MVLAALLVESEEGDGNSGEEEEICPKFVKTPVVVKFAITILCGYRERHDNSDDEGKESEEIEDH